VQSATLTPPVERVYASVCGRELDSRPIIPVRAAGSSIPPAPRIRNSARDIIAPFRSAQAHPRSQDLLSFAHSETSTNY
jgi:hypothetical protein